ncbi:hypothetical protein [Streptomyces sp. CA-106131]|uniref:hypothetical protein n=1 Tax=Streptomyces sp. CA-106131 TaxID=3240045 RepID=UPI003D8C7864
MTAPQDGALPAQDGVRALQQPKSSNLAQRQVMGSPATRNRSPGVNAGFAAWRCRIEILVPEHQDLDLLLTSTHRQQAYQRERAGDGEGGQAQQHG